MLCLTCGPVLILTHRHYLWLRAAAVAYEWNDRARQGNAWWNYQLKTSRELVAVRNLAVAAATTFQTLEYILSNTEKSYIIKICPLLWIVEDLDEIFIRFTIPDQSILVCSWTEHREKCAEEVRSQSLCVGLCAVQFILKWDKRNFYSFFIYILQITWQAHFLYVELYRVGFLLNPFQHVNAQLIWSLYFVSM